MVCMKVIQNDILCRMMYVQPKFLYFKTKKHFITKYVIRVYMSAYVSKEHTTSTKGNEDDMCNSMVAFVGFQLSTLTT